MTVAMTGVLATVIIAGVTVASLASLYAAKTQAETAADAAALAAAVATYPVAATGAPLTSARDAAVQNGATLTECECVIDGRLSPRVVTVEVVVGANVPVFGDVSVRASSRAEFDPGEWLGP
jgi:tetrahydromethanopterin S-methyltransferase subunit D